MLHPRCLLLVYHPQSWRKPHMVSGYSQYRFYRRANYQAKVMGEAEVEAAYAARRVFQLEAERWLAVANLGNADASLPLLRIAMCPKLSLMGYEHVTNGGFTQLINTLRPGGQSGQWLPFAEGWRFLTSSYGQWHGRLFEFRAFANGACCINYGLGQETAGGALDIKSANSVLRDTFAPTALSVVEQLRLAGPALLRISVSGLVHGNPLRLFVGPQKSMVGTLPPGDTSVSLTEETSIEELLTQRDQLARRVLNRLVAAYGIWRF